MLWSATIPTWIKQLTKEFMNAPKFVDLIGAWRAV
jgi:superfamily II DNA/RNA helicase